MNFNSSHKIRRIYNTAKDLSNTLEKDKMEEIAKDRKIDISEFNTLKSIITIATEWITTADGTEFSYDEYNDYNYYNYEFELLNCPIYIIPFIKVTVLYKGDSVISKGGIIQIYDISEEEELINEDRAMNSLKKTFKVCVPIVTYHGLGEEVKVIITIYNPREFR
jgi:hypothetical protein